MNGTNDGVQTVNVLRSLLNALKTIDGPKTMLLVSEGFIAEDQRQSIIELGAVAATAHAAASTR